MWTLSVICGRFPQRENYVMLQPLSNRLLGEGALPQNYGRAEQ